MPNEQPIPLPDDLVSAVAHSFPKEDRERVVAALTRTDDDRCRVAVLVLGTDGGANVSRLEHLVEVAITDYRGVLYWAEYNLERPDYAAA